MIFSLLLGALLACGSGRDAAPACALSEATEVSFEADQAPCVHLTLPESDFEALSAQVRFEGEAEDQFTAVIEFGLESCTEPWPDPFTWFEADLQVDGLSAERVGLRKKGFVGSVMGAAETRPSLKVSLDEYVEDQVLADDTEQLTLNNNLTDLSRVRACTTLSVFADAGYPTPRCNVAGVAVNGVSLGAYAHVEPPKKRFLRRVFGDDSGSLYEITATDFTAQYLSDGLGRWQAKTSDTVPDASLLLGVTAALEAPDDELEAALDAVIDLDAYFTFWALETLVAHMDGYSSNANNTYVYFDPGRGGRAVFIPWGTDDAMSSAELEFARGEIARRLSKNPMLYARYLDTLSALLDEVWDEDRLLDRVDTLSARAAELESFDADNEAITENLRAFIEGRRAEIEDFVAAGGAPGRDQATECTDLGPLDNFTILGELNGTYSHSCTTGPGRAPWGGLLAVLALLGARARRVRGPRRP